MKFEPGPPVALGNAARAGLRLSVWCRGCGHQGEPDPAEMAARYGAQTTVLDWRERLVCSECGGWDVDFVAGGTQAVSVTTGRERDGASRLGADRVAIADIRARSPAALHSKAHGSSFGGSVDRSITTEPFAVSKNSLPVRRANLIRCRYSYPSIPMTAEVLWRGLLKRNLSRAP
jgi:hypothetical protein